VEKRGRTHEALNEPVAHPLSQMCNGISRGTIMSVIVALLMSCGLVGLLISDWANADVAAVIAGAAVVSGVIGALSGRDDRTI
jgi:hypothetical protein